MLDIFIAGIIYLYQVTFNQVESFEALKYAVSWLPPLTAIFGVVIFTISLFGVGAFGKIYTIISLAILVFCSILSYVLASAINSGFKDATSFADVSWEIVIIALAIRVLAQFAFKAKKNAA